MADQPLTEEYITSTYTVLARLRENPEATDLITDVFDDVLDGAEDEATDDSSDAGLQARMRPGANNAGHLAANDKGALGLKGHTPGEARVKAPLRLGAARTDGRLPHANPRSRGKPWPRVTSKKTNFRPPQQKQSNLAAIPEEGAVFVKQPRAQRADGATGRAALAGGAIGGGVAFVFAAAQVGRDGLKTTAEKSEEVAGLTVIGATGGALNGTLDAAWVAPIIAESGMCGSAAGAMAGAGAVAGAATLALSVIWDASKRSRGMITAVEQRKNFMQSSGGTILGTAGGVGTAAGLLALTTPVGWVIAGGMTVGLAGGIIGAALGSRMDGLIWDEGEDEVMHAYEFFGWSESRGSRPTKPMDQMVRAYRSKLAQKRGNDAWVGLCNHEFFVMLRAMFPEMKELCDRAERLKCLSPRSRQDAAQRVLEVLGD